MELKNLYTEISDKLRMYMCNYNCEDETLMMLVDVFYELSNGNSVKRIELPKPKSIEECVEKFINDTILVTTSTKDTMLLDDVYELYKRYCEEKHYGNDFNITKTKLRVIMTSINNSIKYNYALKILTHCRRL